MIINKYVTQPRNRCTTYPVLALTVSDSMLSLHSTEEPNLSNAKYMDLGSQQLFFPPHVLG